MIRDKSDSDLYPVLPLRDTVVFPHMIIPLFVGRKKSINALEEAMCGEKRVFLAVQRNASDDNPSRDEIFQLGTLVNILQLLKLPDGTVKVLVEGGSRARVERYTACEEYLEAVVVLLEDDKSNSVKLEALGRSMITEFGNYIKLNKKVPPEILASLEQIDDYSRLADTVVSHLRIKVVDKQGVLEMTSLVQRLSHVLGLMENEISVLQMEKRIRTRVKLQMEKTQREYYLNEQMKAIQKELGDSVEGRDEFNELEEKIEKTKLSSEAREKALGEFKKLRQMSSISAEAAVVRNFLDWLLSLPWGKKSRVKKDLNEARVILDSEHYGLENIKERIIEYLAVQNRTNKLRGPILCLVGPPGVGKTSLGKSMARATGREFVRMSLGGVRDEAEIRGHRRTYIGAMPGKIIQSMRKSKTVNPLFLLDEIDKIGADFRGDPSSALLEVLDPEQNKAFNDHYMEIGYDLSNVMFVATANTLNIPLPLMDRMEIIRIAGYTESEKQAILQNHLVPKVFREHGLKSGELSVDDESFLALIREYTREAGVRSLERELAKLARKVVKGLTLSGESSIKVGKEALHKFLGVPKYEFGQVELRDQAGVVMGLAWTEMGGELLIVESTVMSGRGRVTITGNLRDVMKESISAASAYVRSHSADFGINLEFLKTRDVHVHVPEGATPKDGPSAGVAMVTTIVSAMTGIPVHREVAMTGEITLRGRVLPIGGLKEKLLAALRGGIKTVLIPQGNVKDLDDIPDDVKKRLDIVPVSEVDEVLARALIRQPQPIDWEDEKWKEKKVGIDNSVSSVARDDSCSPLTAHRFVYENLKIGDVDGVCFLG
ncbi:MAG: endopeptidase La [Alphaproteobacteria bacterium]|nr:endopeptidase La [Alphaproteobacteria bacterium]